MKRFFYLLLFISSTHLSFAAFEPYSLPYLHTTEQDDERDGSSFEKAILIEETTESTGVLQNTNG